jgi:hypothetical protein
MPVQGLPVLPSLLALRLVEIGGIEVLSLPPLESFMLRDRGDLDGTADRFLAAN